MKDQLGNEVREGDLVHVKVGAEWFPGIVMKIQNGGIAMSGIMPKPGQPVAVSPDKMYLQLEWAGMVNPGMPQPGVFKIERPPVPKGLVD